MANSGRLKTIMLATLVLLMAAPATAGSSQRTVNVAQGLFAPPANVPEADDQNDDRAALVLRVERLEADLRRATGAIEELQNQNQRLSEEVRRFRDDVEFRLSGGKTPAAAAAPPAAAPASQPVRKSDAFDPNATPNAAGAPMPLGTTPPSAPLVLAPKVAEAPPPAVPVKPEPAPTVIGSGIDFADGPRSQYNAAVEAYKAGQYQAAEDQFKNFLAANASHKLVPEAIFYLGETYLQRARPREAAEQYLRLSTDYSRSARAPEGMLRLGQSLAMLGNPEQACATFAEVARRYPTASSPLKKSVEREIQKDHC